MMTEVVTHGSPAHLDELVAYLLLKRYGEEKLPGIRAARFRCLTAQDDLDLLRSQGDVVLIGLGAGAFDEHVFNGDASKKNECAATLAAKYLGVDQELRWRRILKYILHTDKNPPNLALDLSATVMRLQQQGWGLHAVLGYVEIALDAALAQADQFINTSTHNIQEEELILNGEKHWMAVIEGDNPQSPAFARTFGAAVVVVRGPMGHVQVLTTNQLRLDMRDVVRILRSREQWAKNQRGVTDWKKLEQEGAIEEVPEWFFHKEANNVLNGGRSRPDIAPTELTLAQIVEAVRIGLEKDRFEPRRQERCQQGTCTSTPKNPCPWYNLGLLRCRAIRAKAYRQKEEQAR